MSNHDRRSEWTVLIGIGLVVLGLYLFLGSFAGWLVAPIAAIIRVASRVIWPLVLIGIGVLLVLRARGGGWAPSGRKLYRAREERMIAGVLGGVAKWLGVNPTPVRIVYALFTVFTGFGWGILAYVLARGPASRGAMGRRRLRSACSTAGAAVGRDADAACDADAARDRHARRAARAARRARTAAGIRRAARTAGPARRARERVRAAGCRSPSRTAGAARTARILGPRTVTATSDGRRCNAWIPR